jgi:16S rRNA (cytosine1402-N4)-methyltransferase
MDANRGVPAREIIAEYGEFELADLFWQYGEERNSRRIARAIVLARKKKKIDTTTDLADIIRSAIPATKKVKTVTRCFQALRYKVNDELSSLKDALEQVPPLLKTGGRLVAISYESLTDRIIKQFLVREQKGCRCPVNFPKCTCNHTPTMKILTKRPVVPTAEEIQKNRRARGAKLRSGQRVAG